MILWQWCAHWHQSHRFYLLSSVSWPCVACWQYWGHFIVIVKSTNSSTAFTAKNQGCDVWLPTGSCKLLTLPLKLLVSLPIQSVVLPTDHMSDQSYPARSEIPLICIASIDYVTNVTNHTTTWICSKLSISLWTFMPFMVTDIDGTLCVALLSRTCMHDMHDSWVNNDYQWAGRCVDVSANVIQTNFVVFVVVVVTQLWHSKALKFLPWKFGAQGPSLIRPTNKGVHSYQW